MKKPSDAQQNWSAEREKIIGLGERSLRKTYYPELQQKLDELERFRALLDQSNDCIFLLEAATLTFVDVNESACRQLGCSREEFISFPLGNFLPKEATARVENLVSSGPAQGWDQDTITTQMCKCSGEKLPVEITIRLVTFNKILYGVAVARDITERKRAEKALLENSRMLRDMELARQIQLSLLPTAPPKLPGVLLAGCCVPATHVGGDYYDYYERENGVVDMVIADVSGHSIGAALMTAEARSVLHAEVQSFSHTGDILASLNEILYNDLNQAELFITLFYVKYDTLTHTLTYSNAGHVSPLLTRNSGATCLKLDAEGLILGVKKGVSFEEKQLRMEKGDLLFLYTDGVTESRNSAGELFGLGRLCDLINARHAEPPQAIIDAVLEDVSAFTGTSALEDDVTMVAMKVV
ncbi:SpoIIE family protein phosphatase [Geotalea uraniireducens]|uniref:Putative PAS/PAC sensor protein n=1 Tax=Geotalea uraniireducens (strain Rf4) TaxID=351605 RepID=A5G7C0_GEOUR|nr:SpoIIE family protein phosphatase [Geotalea uraniireducens]ABQ27688.1 putative PAS/PAC sensor protein [Geotalea uraniireducens Rf4]